VQQYNLKEFTISILVKKYFYIWLLKIFLYYLFDRKLCDNQQFYIEFIGAVYEQPLQWHILLLQIFQSCFRILQFLNLSKNIYNFTTFSLYMTLNKV